MPPSSTSFVQPWSVFTTDTSLFSGEGQVKLSVGTSEKMLSSLVVSLMLSQNVSQLKLTEPESAKLPASLSLSREKTRRAKSPQISPFLRDFLNGADQLRYQKK